MISWKVVAAGSLTSSVSTWLANTSHSPFVIYNLPWLASGLTAMFPLLVILAIVGAFTIAFGLLWGRWYWAAFIGTLFSIAALIVSFWR